MRKKTGAKIQLHDYEVFLENPYRLDCTNDHLNQVSVSFSLHPLLGGAFGSWEKKWTRENKIYYLDIILKLNEAKIFVFGIQLSMDFVMRNAFLPWFFLWIQTDRKIVFLISVTFSSRYEAFQADVLHVWRLFNILFKFYWTLFFVYEDYPNARIHQTTQASQGKTRAL